jgi:hypothetical protein
MAVLYSVRRVQHDASDADLCGGGGSQNALPVATAHADAPESLAESAKIFLQIRSVFRVNPAARRTVVAADVRELACDTLSLQTGS